MEHQQSVLSKVMEKYGIDTDNMTESELYSWMLDNNEKFSYLELLLAEQLSLAAKICCKLND